MLVKTTWARAARFILASSYLALPLQIARSAERIKVPMTAERWQANGDIQFIPSEGFPQGLLTVKNGGAVLKGVTFGDGTIEYDIKELPEGDGIPGIRFRQLDADTAEQFYLRPSPNCPASDDCVQYAPITHGLLLWDIYPQYQAPAPVRENGWNHVKLVISGRRMNVFINGEPTPSLRVGRLEGDAPQGAIQLRGAATFANLTVTDNAVEGLSPIPVADSTDGDERFFRNWRVSAPANLPVGRAPALAEMPVESRSWQNMTAERHGLVNLSRLYGPPLASPAVLAWLKNNIISDRDQEKRVSIGWAREIWVYVNGKWVFSATNFYYPEDARKPPDGRLSLENGSFNLPLRKGSNEIVVALSNVFPQGHSHYGWGMELRLDDLNEVKVRSDKNLRTDLH